MNRLRNYTQTIPAGARESVQGLYARKLLIAEKRRTTPSRRGAGDRDFAKSETQEPTPSSSAI